MNTPPAPFMQRLARLVVKDEVGLGGLCADDRALALAVVWASLPAGLCTNEPGINAHLKSALGGAAAWLDLDHVELRRWLVDAGWLLRDGYSREYRRVEAAALPERQCAWAPALAAIDIGHWVSVQRAAQHDARESRRRAWLASQAAQT